MSVKELTGIVLPPGEPVNSGGRKEWNAAATKLGIVLPEDYYALARTYGSGKFLAGTLEIGNPFDPDYETWVDYELSKLRQYKATFPDEMPYNVHPEEDGLYPFGRDDNGNRFFWKTAGESDRWSIICYSRGADSWESVNHTLSDFLILLITNRLQINWSRFWGAPFPEEQRVFVPQQPVTRPKRTAKRQKD